jgi:hypothetical protein
MWGFRSERFPHCTAQIGSAIVKRMKRAICLLLVAACSRTTNHAHTQAKHEDRHDPAIAKPALKLAVTIDGSGSTWQQDVFDRVPHFEAKNHDGDDRDTWSLRELVHSTVGPNARVVAVVGDARMPIDRAAWDDPNHTPIVHRTRRGWLKFRWADKNGAWQDAAVKEVTGLEITR